MMETLASGFGLLEGPVWDPGRGFLFTDAEKGGAYCLDMNGQISTVFEHRRGIGGMVRHVGGGVVISGRNVAYKGPAAAPTVVLLDKEPAKGIVGFNDMTTDRHGRIYVGALGFLPTETELAGIGGDTTPAPLFVIDLDGSIRQLHPKIKLTNGMGFSPDGTRLYHADSGDRIVYVYDVETDGSVNNRRPFASVSEGLPDGLAVSADGAVWVAVAHGGQVLIFAPDGSRQRRIDFPLPMVTSLCFGGDDLRDVYVVSGSDGSGRVDAGTIYRMRSDVPGLPQFPAQVRLPQ
jgi:sugar lactone lactonase YvrE